MSKIVAIKGKALPSLTLALTLVLAACSTTAINNNSEPETRVVPSKNIALMPYNTQGVTVAGSTSWHYGETQGLAAYPAKGGIVYVVSANESESKGQNTNAVLNKPEVNYAGLTCSQDTQQGTLLSMLHFKFAQILLDNKSEETLNELIEKAKTIIASQVHIVGYTDDIGTDQVNLPLSKQRADFIAAEIKKIRPDLNITTEGKAGCPKIASNLDEQGRALNRRVEIYAF